MWNPLLITLRTSKTFLIDAQGEFLKPEGDSAPADALLTNNVVGREDYPLKRKVCGKVYPKYGSWKADRRLEIRRGLALEDVTSRAILARATVVATVDSIQIADLWLKVHSFRLLTLQEFTCTILALSSFTSLESLFRVVFYRTFQEPILHHVFYNSTFFFEPGGIGSVHRSKWWCFRTDWLFSSWVHGLWFCVSKRC